MQTSKTFGAGRLTRKESHDTAFAACVGTELTETLCDELEIDSDEVKEVSHGTKVMNCVFSYKVKTVSEGNETQCKARLNCDDRYQSESTYSETSSTSLNG
jgi:hypothetical protein